jgi:hypothetical protein
MNGLNGSRGLYKSNGEFIEVMLNMIFAHAEMDLSGN